MFYLSLSLSLCRLYSYVYPSLTSILNIHTPVPTTEYLPRWSLSARPLSIFSLHRPEQKHLSFSKLSSPFISSHSGHLFSSACLLECLAVSLEGVLWRRPNG